MLLEKKRLKEEGSTFLTCFFNPLYNKPQHITTITTMSSHTAAKPDTKPTSSSSTTTITTVAKKAGSGGSTTALTRTRPVYKSNIPAPAPQVILEEDDYIEALSKIIERDFFPDLARLKRQHAYLDAVEQNDSERIQAAARELAGNDTPLAKRRRKTPGKDSMCSLTNASPIVFTDKSNNYLTTINLKSFTPIARTPRFDRDGLPNESWTPARLDGAQATPSWGDHGPSTPAFPEPIDTPMAETPSQSNLKSRIGEETAQDAIDTSLSLDQFQMRYTSEDNASFNEIIEKINAQKKEKYKWLYDQEKKSIRLLENGNDNQEQRLLREAGETGEGSSNSQALVRVEDSSKQDGPSKLELALADNRSGVISTWEYKVSISYITA